MNTTRNMRTRFRRTITILAVTALTAAGGVAFAGTADAASYSQCHPIYTANPGDGVCWVSYNWWEHMWGYQDHWEYEPGLYNTAYGW